MKKNLNILIFIFLLLGLTTKNNSGMIREQDEKTTLSELFNEFAAYKKNEIPIESYNQLKDILLNRNGYFKDDIEAFKSTILNPILDKLTKNLSSELENNQINIKSLQKKINNYIELESVNNTNIITIGDLHGNFKALDAIITTLINQKVFINDSLKLRDDHKIIVLGDYIDRGLNSLENILILMVLKLINPDNVILLQGNHEDIDIFAYDRAYNLRDELKQKLNENYEIIKTSYVKKFQNCFKLLPTAYLLKNNQNEVFVFNHAGWTSELKSQEIYEALSLLENNGPKAFLHINKKFAEELTWNDIYFYPKRKFKQESNRGAGYEYGMQTVFNEMLGNIDDLKKSTQKEERITLNYLIGILEDIKADKDKLKFVAKFGGHMHRAPKTTFDELKEIIMLNDKEYTPGFKHFQDETGKSHIYTLMGGSLEPHYKNGEAVTKSYINYFPSYLILFINDSGWQVRGFIIRDLEIEL
ncbi:MAG: metallophosphoesterase family protein [bacterium]